MGSVFDQQNSGIILRSSSQEEDLVAEPAFFRSSQGSRVSEVLFGLETKGFTNIAHLPSNVLAVEACLLFAADVRPFVAITGPSGWGKSHLLEAVAERLSDESHHSVPILTASEWALGLTRHDPAMPLVLDTVQEALQHTRTRQALRMGLERRIRAGKRTLIGFTSNKGARSLKAFLPDLRQWMIGTITSPSVQERYLVITQLAAQERVVLSKHLVLLLAKRMRGNGRALAGALKRLKLSGSHWSNTRTTLRAIGILDPFFVDDSEWDLRDSILRAVEDVASVLPESRRRAMAAYLMLKVACLPEAQVATFFAVEPSQAYLLANSYERSRSESPLHDQFEESAMTRAVESLLL